MKQKDILIEVINDLYAYGAERNSESDFDMNDFIGYLNTKYTPDSLALRKVEGDEEKWVKEKFTNTDRDISILFSLIHRYTKVYAKKAFENSIINTQEEFSFLIALMTYGSLTKTELINEQVVEKTSGTEIIKRLLGNGLITESADEKDKRSVRVSITEKGRQEIIALMPKMQMLSSISVGILNESQKNSLAYLLKKLDYHHHDIFSTNKNASLEELSKIVTNKSILSSKE